MGMRVAEMQSGMVIQDPTQDVRWTYIGQICPHPLYSNGSLCMVIWRNDRGEWSHDALDYMQDVGQPLAALSDPASRRDNLRRALLSSP